MAFDLVRVEAEFALVDWRNRELEAVTAQITAALPALMALIESHVAQMGTFAVGRAHLYPKSLTEELLAPWIAQQSAIAASRAKEGLAELTESLPTGWEIGGHLQSALPAAAGAGLLAASVIGLPTVVSYATITTTSLFFFTTSSLSLPVLLAGGTVLAGLSFAGVRTMDHAMDKTRRHLVQRVQAAALAAVTGYGLPPDARTLITDLQAAALDAGQALLAGKD